MIALPEVGLRLGIDYIKYSFRRVERALVRVVQIGEEVDRTVKHRGVRKERDQKTCGNKFRAFYYEPSAYPPYYKRAAGYHEPDDIRKQRSYFRGVYIGFEPSVIILFKGIEALFLVCERFNDAYSGNRVGQYRGHRRPASPYPAVKWRYLFAEYSRAYYDKRNRNKRKQGKLPVHGEHYHYYSYKQEKLNHYLLRYSEHK